MTKFFVEHELFFSFFFFVESATLDLNVMEWLRTLGSLIMLGKATDEPCSFHNTLLATTLDHNV
jgi:hypothetical protein